MIPKKTKILIYLLAVVPFFAIAQVSEIEGEIESVNGAKLSILTVYPDSFPKVSVVFRAQNASGEPVWNIAKESLAVKENLLKSEIVSVESLSKNQSVNISLVVDHSGSMQVDFSQLYDKYGFPKFKISRSGDVIYPKGYMSPIESAKKAVTEFISDFDFTKDYINVVGFSSTIDVNLPLSNRRSEIESTINNLKADSSTAFYDAVHTGILELQKSKGINILIALTDGNDNSSKLKFEELISIADTSNIPLYIVGLGAVNQDSLKQIAVASNGEYYYAKSASTLNEIYKSISERIQAYYNLIYVSENLNSLDSNRSIVLEFKIDSATVLTAENSHTFPPKLVALAEEKAFKNNVIIYGGGALAVVGIGFIFFIALRKRKNENQIA